MHRQPAAGPFLADAPVHRRRHLQHKRLQADPQQQLRQAVAQRRQVVVADPTRADGEGWVMSYVYDRATDRSEVHVLDASDIAAGPVATVKLPRRVPFGFHGSWMPA